MGHEARHDVVSVATLSGVAAPFSSFGVTASGWRSFARDLSLALSASVAAGFWRAFRRWGPRLRRVGLGGTATCGRRRGRAPMNDLDLDGNDFQSALRSLAPEHPHAQQQYQHKGVQDGGKRKTSGALTASRLARAGRADPQGLLAAKVHGPS